MSVSARLETKADYEPHEPDYSGTSTSGWDVPDEGDFDIDDSGEIANRCLGSASGFPPDPFTDLKLPVVAPNDDLNENALQTARGGSHGVEAIDDTTKQDVKICIEHLSDTEFDENFGG